MKNFIDIIKELKAPTIQDNLSKMQGDEKTPYSMNFFKINDKVSPYNLYLYLSSRFNKPNGFLSLCRQEDSNQLFHWHYSLQYNDMDIQIMCATYRIEVLVPKELISSDDECVSFLNELIKDIERYKKEATLTRKNIENWELIVNPFARIQKQINLLISEVESLKDKIPSFTYSHIEGDEHSLDNFSQWYQLTEELSAKSYSLKCLVPVYIETFLNFIIQVLAKQELKDDKIQYDKFIREHINIKIQKLHEKCTGFFECLDLEEEICKKILKIFNKRNDLLHGNFNIKSLKYGEIGFIKCMPLYKEFSSFQKEILNLELANCNLETVLQEIEDSQTFMMYVLINLETEIFAQIKSLLESYTLGWNKDTKRFGILFNNNLVDFIAK